MKTVPLSAFPRKVARRSGVKQLRTQGRVPAVIYGRQIQPQNLEIKSKEIEDLLHQAASENLLVDLSVSEDARPKRLALVQEIQHHPLSGKILHVDLHEVQETEKVTVMVPVEAVGEADGVKNSGGILEHVMFKLRVRALPKDLPEYIEVDVTHLKIGESIHIGDIKPPPQVELLGDKKLSVLAVAAPLTEEQAAALEAAATEPVSADVEMIKEKKEEGEGEAAPAAKGAEKGAPAAKPGEKAAAPAAGAEKAPAAGEKKPAAAEKKPAAGKK